MAIAWLRFSTPDPGGMTERPGGATTTDGSGPDAGAPPSAATSAGEPRRPRSLRGTRIDGGLAVDTAGRFLPTIDARRLFDYFLAATGEAAPDVLRARIVAEIERRLSPGAAREATALLDRYIAYRERVRLMAADPPRSTVDLEARVTTLEALRREMLGPVAADAFFADDEARARRVLEVRRIASDPALSSEERAARVEAIYAGLEADLPPESREARAAGRLATSLREAEDEVRANGGGPAEIQALRERLAGPEVAARLAELDETRARWMGRVNDFRKARERIANDGTLSPSERAAATQTLLERSFTPSERLRVEALDRIAESNAPPP